MTPPLLLASVPAPLQQHAPQTQHPHLSVQPLSQQHVANQLGISRSTIYELFRAGQLSTVKVGKRGVRVPLADITRFVEQGGYQEGSQWQR